MNNNVSNMHIDAPPPALPRARSSSSSADRNPFHPVGGTGRKQ